MAMTSVRSAWLDELLVPEIGLLTVERRVAESLRREHVLGVGNVEADLGGDGGELAR